MNKNIVGAAGLSLLLLLGPSPTILLAHEGHEHGSRQDSYGERKDTGRYDPQYDDDQYDDDAWEEDDDYTRRPSSQPYPPSSRERSSPHERRDRSQ